MSVYQVNKMLRDINLSSELIQRYQTAPKSIMQGYDLSAEERQAVAGWQVRQLYDMGVNPLLLLVYSLAQGKDLPAYVAAMNEKS